jgi:hypothetical protein
MTLNGAIHQLRMALFRIDEARENLQNAADALRLGKQDGRAEMLEMKGEELQIIRKRIANDLHVLEEQAVIELLKVKP